MRGVFGVPSPPPPVGNKTGKERERDASCLLQKLLLREMHPSLRAKAKTKASLLKLDSLSPSRQTLAAWLLLLTEARDVLFVVGALLLASLLASYVVGDPLCREGGEKRRTELEAVALARAPSLRHRHRLRRRRRPGCALSPAPPCLRACASQPVHRPRRRLPSSFTSVWWAGSQQRQPRAETHTKNAHQQHTREDREEKPETKPAPRNPPGVPGPPDAPSGLPCDPSDPPERAVTGPGGARTAPTPDAGQLSVSTRSPPLPHCLTPPPHSTPSTWA